MKAIEIMEGLFALAEAGDYTESCDTCKAGDPQRQVKRVAVAMFPTPDVLRQAAAWGAELLIVHEPMYYNHRDVHSEEPLEMEKRALVEQTGLTVWRYHDHTHATRPDIIAVGQLDALDLAGEMVLTDGGDRVEYILEKSLTPLELKARLEEKWGLQNIRLCGTRETPCRRISCMFGAPGKAAFERLVQPDCEMMLIGEATEWSMAEYARDAHQLGHTKALFILGHEGSEREGMVYTAKLLRKMYPELTVQYFESGEVY